MKEFIGKLIGRLEEIRQLHADLSQSDLLTEEEQIVQSRFCGCFCKAKAIVNQLAEEYNTIDVNELFEEMEQNDGWIPCSEKLPEEYGEYLCCDTYGNFIIGYPSESNTSNTGFVVETEHEYCYDIIAWQPLPAPYQTK